MSSEPLVLDPEVEEILRDIAKDPNSSLLRVERPTRPAGLIERWEPMSAQAPGLTAAERELLRVYRSEVAFLLRQRFLIEVWRNPPQDLVTDRRDPIGHADRPSNRAAWNERAAEALVEFDASEPQRSVLRACVTASPEHQLDLHSLVEASMRLEPTDQGRCYLAFLLNLSKQPVSVRKLIGRVLDRSTSTFLSTYCWENIGAAETTLNRYQAAREAYARSWNEEYPRVLPLLGWLRMSLRTHDAESVRRVAEILDDGVSPDDAALNDGLTAEQRRLAMGVWTLDGESRRMLQPIIDSYGPTSRRVANALVS